MLLHPFLLQLLQRYGITIKSKPITIAKPPNKNDMEATLANASKDNWQLAIIILNNTTDNVYDYIKQCGNQRYGLVTQCVSYQSLERNLNKLDMCKNVPNTRQFSFLLLIKCVFFKDTQNLSQKINAKMGCINGIVNLKAALSRPIKEDLFMFFGADVSNSLYYKCNDDYHRLFLLDLLHMTNTFTTERTMQICRYTFE